MVIGPKYASLLLLLPARLLLCNQPKSPVVFFLVSCGPFPSPQSTFGLKMRVQVKKRVETKNTGSARVMQKGECTAPGNRYKASKTNKRKYTRARGRTHTASDRHRLRSFTKHKGKLCRDLDRPMQDPTVISRRGEITGPVGHRNVPRGVLPGRPRWTVCIRGAVHE